MANRIDGLEIEVDGEGKPVVFIHGWLGSIESWNLTRSFLELDVEKIFYSQKCHGKSICDKFSIESLANDLKALIEELELIEPILVGHSMGGMTALKYASMYENFSGLLLLTTSASTPEPETGSPKYFLEEFENLRRQEWSRKITGNYLSKDTDTNIWNNSVKELENAKEEPVIYGLKSMIEYDIRDSIKNIDKPCKVVAASKDGAITMDKSKELAHLLDADIEVLECGHLLLHEKPEETANIIEEFISKIQ